MTVATSPKPSPSRSSTPKEPRSNGATTGLVHDAGSVPGRSTGLVALGTSITSTGRFSADTRFGTLAARDVDPVRRDHPRPVSAIGTALSRLQDVLRADPDPDLWQEAVRALRAVTAHEHGRARRHAALALLLADALSYSTPSDLRDPEQARAALEAGARALSEPFVSTDTEREVTSQLLRTGWQLTLPYRGWAATA